MKNVRAKYPALVAVRPGAVVALARLMAVFLTLCLACSCMKEAPPPVVPKEEDYYPSGKTYTLFDGTGWEKAVIHYDYGKGLYFLHYLGTNNVLAKIA